MQLPPAFTEKIPRAFGERGRMWLEQLPQIVALCQERWHLAEIRPLEELSYNLVCSAESQSHGSVVLKVGVPHPELFTEMKALSLYAGRGICRCLDADAELGAMLLERIRPGSDLTGVSDNKERFRVAAELIATLPVALAGDHGFPHYGDWVTRAFTRVRAENKGSAELLSLVDRAESYFREIDAPGQPRFLLHGDLHHRNILRDGQHGWRAIDPKGVIGVRCLEAARFMQNQFGMDDRADRLASLDQMAAVFADRLGETKQRLAQCAFVDTVLSTCWSVEESAAPDFLRTAVEECGALFGYCMSVG